MDYALFPGDSQALSNWILNNVLVSNSSGNLTNIVEESFQHFSLTPTPITCSDRTRETFGVQVYYEVLGTVEKS